MLLAGFQYPISQSQPFSARSMVSNVLLTYVLLGLFCIVSFWSQNKHSNLLYNNLILFLLIYIEMIGFVIEQFQAHTIKKHFFFHHLY